MGPVCHITVFTTYGLIHDVYSLFERFLEDGRECAQRFAGEPERADPADDITAVFGLVPVDDREHDLLPDTVLLLHRPEMIRDSAAFVRFRGLHPHMDHAPALPDQASSFRRGDARLRALAPVLRVLRDDGRREDAPGLPVANSAEVEPVPLERPPGREHDADQDDEDEELADNGILDALFQQELRQTVDREDREEHGKAEERGVRRQERGEQERHQHRSQDEREGRQRVLFPRRQSVKIPFPFSLGRHVRRSVPSDLKPC